MDALLVEDSATARAMLAYALTRRGHVVTAVADAESAWKLCEARDFELIILDWVLPGMDGVTLCRRIRALPHGDRSVILLATSKESDDDLAAALDAGASDYLPKSAGTAALTIRLAVAERRAAEIALRLQAERELRAQYAFTRAITTSLGEGVYTLDRDGLVTFMNPAAEAMIGWTLDELHGQPMHERIHFQRADGSRVAAADCPLLAVIRSGETIASDADVFTHKDGAAFPVEYTSAPIRLDGVVIGATLAFRDITLRKRAEEVLRNSEARFRQIVEFAPVAMAITDAAGVFESANDAYCALFSYTRDELVGRPFSILVPEDQRAGEDAAYARRVTDHVEGQRELALQTKAGDRLIVLGNALPLATPDGRIVRVSFAIDITARKQAEHDLTRLAHYDRLTGLANRTLFALRLEAVLDRARAQREGAALLFVDLDGFKAVNDTYGHAAGDGLLRAAAERLRASVRDGDTVARLAGDEFTVVLPSIAKPADAEGVARKVLAALALPVELPEGIVHVSGSVGLALFPADGSDAASLLATADAAMYLAKRGGKNRYARGVEGPLPTF